MIPLALEFRRDLHTHCGGADILQDLMGYWTRFADTGDPTDLVLSLGQCMTQAPTVCCSSTIPFYGSMDTTTLSAIIW